MPVVVVVVVVGVPEAADLTSVREVAAALEGRKPSAEPPSPQMSRGPPNQRSPSCLSSFPHHLHPPAGRVYTRSATAARVAMVSWLPTGSWLGTQEACPLWPCLNLATAAWQEAVRSRRLALASPSGAQAVGFPESGWISTCPCLAPGCRCGCHLPSSCGHGLSSSSPQGLSLCTRFFPTDWGSEAAQL